jgi:hypothetical protein
MSAAACCISSPAVRDFRRFQGRLVRLLSSLEIWRKGMTSPDRWGPKPCHPKQKNTAWKKHDTCMWYPGKNRWHLAMYYSVFLPPASKFRPLSQTKTSRFPQKLVKDFYKDSRVTHGHFIGSSLRILRPSRDLLGGNQPLPAAFSRLPALFGCTRPRKLDRSGQGSIAKWCYSWIYWWISINNHYIITII